MTRIYKTFVHQLLLTFLLFTSATVFANDVVIAFGESQSNAPQWKYKGGGSNYDGQNWKDIGFTETGWLTGKSAFGFGTNPPSARNTNIPEDASAGGGGISGTRYTTMYFRMVVNIANPASYAAFQLRTKFDDGIVVWINGTEAFRNNIGANPSYATFATAAITNNGADIFTGSVSSSLFVPGNNIIAVEIHQNQAASSDLFFDLELTGITQSNNAFIPFGDGNGGAPQWKYKGGGSNYDGQNWKDIGFVETGWLTGGTAFGFGTNPPAARNTNIPEDASAGGGGIANSRYPTMYFRKILNIPNPSAYLNFLIRAKFDDGIVIWINGVEAFRNNIAANPVYATLADVAITNNGADIFSGTVSTALFVPGNNIIAVEVHQNLVTSSDFFFDMELTGMSTASLTRGPYLQSGKQDSITIRWRTDVATDSKVSWGTIHGNYTASYTNPVATTEHIVRIGKLLPDTKYYYTIGGSTYTLQSGTDNRFTTLPPDNPNRKLRFLALGDCGNNSSNQVNVKNTFMNFIGSNEIDAMILLGDNAYQNGTDGEYQSNFFDIYKNDLLKYYKMYPSPGNHDYANSDAFKGSRNLPYHQNFTVPMAGEIGGVPSGVTNYYSFNVGDVHFISLDTYGRDDNNSTQVYDTSGTQATWLKQDLAANNKKWTVVFCHHPPYTKTSHNFDTEADLEAIRDRLTPILERYGVDMLLCGHSHGYERTYLMKNMRVDDNFFDKALHTPNGDTLSAVYDGSPNSCPYTYASGRINHGTVYVVSGSAGQIGGVVDGYPLNFAHYSNATNGGCLYFEVDSNRMDVKFVSYTTAPNYIIRDQYTVFKDVNKVTDITVLQNAPLTLTASWKGTYSWPGNGNATTQAVAAPTTTLGEYSYIVNDNYSCIKDSFRVKVTNTTALCGPSAVATLYAGATGAVYQWQVNNGTGFSNISNNGNYTGAATGVLQLSNLPTSWSGYTYRCVVDAANSTVFELRFYNTWTGAINTAWENPANWSCGIVPDAYTDVLINSGTAILNSNTAVRSISVKPGASFTINTGYTLLTK